MSTKIMPDPKPKPHPGWSLALDYGPLLAFFLAYRMSGVFTGTAVFMAAIILAVIVSRWKLGRVSPMLWLSAILVVGFGALTIWFHDPVFIQLKPTIIYALLASLLLGGLAFGRPLLKHVLEAGYDGLSDRGWTILSRNWGLFFVAMAILNESLRYFFNRDNNNLDTYLTIKVWVVPILSLIFALGNVPVMMKHGFTTTPPVPPLD
jgi:intracellular septation protein